MPDNALRRTRGRTAALMVTLSCQDELEAIGTQALSPAQRAMLRAAKASVEALRLDLVAGASDAALELVAIHRAVTRP